MEHFQAAHKNKLSTDESRRPCYIPQQQKQYYVERLLKNEYSGANMPSNTSTHSRCGKNFLPTEANKNADTKPNEGKDF